MGPDSWYNYEFFGGIFTPVKCETVDKLSCNYVYHVTSCPWIFRPSYGPVMHLGVEYGNQTENRQKFAVFHPYVSFCIQEWMVFARKMTKGLSMSDYPHFTSVLSWQS